MKTSWNYGQTTGRSCDLDAKASCLKSITFQNPAAESVHVPAAAEGLKLDLKEGIRLKVAERIIEFLFDFKMKCSVVAAILKTYPKNQNEGLIQCHRRDYRTTCGINDQSSAQCLDG